MKFKISFFTLMFYLSLLISSHRALFIIFITAALHELGHLIAARCRGVSVTEINISLMGARITLGGTYSYSDEIIVALCGPLVNIISAAVSYQLITRLGERDELILFCYSSLSLALSNLLPIRSFDGGRILESALLKRFNLNFCSTIISITSFLFLFAIWSVSVYMLLRRASNLSLFIFSISVFNDIFIKK